MDKINKELRIDGYSSCPGGEYDKVRIDGKGKINGNLKCNKFSTSGIGKVNGNVETEELNISGLLTIIGNIKATEADISGVGKIKGKASGENLKCDGSINIEADIEFENININGMITNNAFINCENLCMYLGGRSECNEIGASKIYITGNEKSKNIFSLLIPKKYKENKLIANIIEGDEIKLECCDVKVVKGKNIRIGANCIINEIEYSENIEIDSSSKVINIKKI